jgi:hypothetical protein
MAIQTGLKKRHIASWREGQGDVQNIGEKSKEMVNPLVMMRKRQNQNREAERPLAPHPKHTGNRFSDDQCIPMQLQQYSWKGKKEKG